MECYGGEESAQTSLGPKRMRQNSAYLLLYERVSTNEKDMPGDGTAEDDLHGIEKHDYSFFQICQFFALRIVVNHNFSNNLRFPFQEFV